MQRVLSLAYLRGSTQQRRRWTDSRTSCPSYTSVTARVELAEARAGVAKARAATSEAVAAQVALEQAPEEEEEPMEDEAEEPMSIKLALVDQVPGLPGTTQIVLKARKSNQISSTTNVNITLPLGLDKTNMKSNQNTPDLTIWN
ncbi:hypothetical protein R6Q59_024746 [Mikania micrantha]